MYFALIFQHLKLSLDVLALRIYIHTLLKTQKLSANLARYILHLGTIAGDKAAIVVEQYSEAGIKEITFRHQVRKLTIPAPRFEINKL